MSAEQQEESIHQYICSHCSTDPEGMTDLGIRWMDLCEKMGVDINYVRRKMDHWFLEAYNSRSQLDEVVMDTTGRIQKRKDALYWKFFVDFDKILENEEGVESIQMNAAKRKLKNKYPLCTGDLVELAIQCVTAEFELLNAHVDQQRQSQQIQEAIGKVEQSITDATHKQMRLNEGIKALTSKVSTLSDLHENQEETQAHFADFRNVSPLLPRQNGTLPDQPYFTTQLQQIGDDINDVSHKVREQHQELSEMFNELYRVLSELVSTLEAKVQVWQKELKFDYAELAASVDLETQVAPCCARTGKILHDVLNQSLVSWQNTIGNLPGDSGESFRGDCSVTEQLYRNMMTKFIKRTFVVTEQGNFFIKTGNKRFPKFCVRILAADHFNRHAEETTAHFVSEEDIRICWKENDIDLKKMQRIERKLKNSRLRFTAESGKKKMECCFQNLQFEQSFKRSQKEQTKQVHEEKYRVVFTTKVADTYCWTLSLPLVVTTASNQEAHSLASIMWQCFSTDVFSPLSDIPEELPWSKVGEMLSKKMSRLSLTHRLSMENITHLKNRLFGEEDLSDDTPVSLTQFCWNAMEDTEFSFWKWFLGIYNLIEQYLQQFWHDGLIMGFVKKEAAEKMLETSDKAGEFILRFSDKHFTNSDGRKSVYGRLTSCVVVMKDAKGNKRDSLGQVEQVKRKVVEHVDVADFKKLGGEFKKLDTEEGSRNNLANILKETWIKTRDGSTQVPMYRVLYPIGKSREQLFDKYCVSEEGGSVFGYKHTREAYIAILEQTMSKINIAKQGDAAIADTPMHLGTAKKAKRGRENVDRIRRSPRGSSSCPSSMSSPQGSPFTIQSPHTSSQSPFYASQSPGYPDSSPAQSDLSPSFAAHFQTQANIDPMAFPSTSNSQLPTVLGEAFPENSTRSEVVQTTSSCRFGQSDLLSDMMEEQPDSIRLSTLDGCTVDQLFSQEPTPATDVTGSGVCAPVEGSQIPFGGADLNVVEFETECGRNTDSQTIVVIQNGDQLCLRSLPNTEEPILQNRQHAYAFLSANLPQERFQQVQRWIDEYQASLDPVVEHTPDTSTGHPPGSTSSGSAGDLFGYSGNQLVAMGSGDIDPSFTQPFTESEMQEGNT